MRVRKIAKQLKRWQRNITFDKDEEPIYNYILNNGTVHINTIRSATGIAMHELMSKLVDMEFRGVIKSMPGSFYSL